MKRLAGCYPNTVDILQSKDAILIDLWQNTGLQGKKMSAGMVVEQKIAELSVCPENIPCPSMGNLYQYWLDLKTGADLPHWDRFDPANVPHVLPDVMLFEARDSGDFHVGIAGNACATALELTASSKPLAEFLPEAAVGDVRQRLEMVRDQETPHLVRKNMAWKADGDDDQRAREYTVLFLPFRLGRNGISHKILNSMHFHTD